MKRFLILFALLVVLAMPTVAMAEGEGDAGKGESKTSSIPEDHRYIVAAFLACSVAFITAVSILGAAYAVAHVGSAAIGAASEKPEMMGRSLVFVALGEGLAIIGLIVAVMLYTILKELV